jgi:haloacetate dehalogenase
MLDGFEAATVQTGETEIFLRCGGSGPPVLLLHGFPQTHLMWRGVAPLLAREFTVVCADLRGYGRSGCPASDPDHAPYARRALARDMVAVMERLGFPRFAVAGHDRGGRVAHRLALDHPDRIERLAVLDVIPTAEAWARAEARFALAFWPWSLLAQPAPLPERLLAAAPGAVVDDALGGWGSHPGGVRPRGAGGLRGGAARPHPRARHLRGVPGRGDPRPRAGRGRSRGRAARHVPGPGALERPRAAGQLVRRGGRAARALAGLGRRRPRPAGGRGHFFPEELPGETADALCRFFAAAP